MIAAASIAPLVLALLSAAVDVTARPEDTRCPRRVALAAALEGRVPEQADGWSVRYRVESRTAENHVWLELRDEDGDLRLRRELAIADDGCDAAADGIALIVARYFREVQWTGAVPLPDMERKADPPPPPVASPPGRPWELEAGLALRREVGLSPGLALGARLPFGRHWLVGAGVVLQATLSRLAGTGGNVRLWSVPLRASVRRQVARGALAFDGGPQVTAAYQRAVITGYPSLDPRLVVAAGGVGSVRWAFAHGWTFGLEFAVEVTVVAPDFVIPSMPAPETILAPHRVQALGFAGVARAF